MNPPAYKTFATVAERPPDFTVVDVNTPLVQDREDRVKGFFIALFLIALVAAAGFLFFYFR